MVLKTLDVLGPLHGFGIARRIEQIQRRFAGRKSSRIRRLSATRWCWLEVVLAMLLLRLVATWIPAQRALSIDPAILLREE